MARIESPSSITTYNTCPRKYYYSYKLSLPKKDNISAITGKAVHEALEKFFKLKVEDINYKDYEMELKQYLLVMFNDSWISHMEDLNKLEINKDVIRNYYQDSYFMLSNFIEDFLQSLKVEIHNSDFENAFNKMRPLTEVYLFSEDHKVQGYLDVIANINGDVYIIDYKTSSKDDLTDDYRLQLFIYALLFKEKYNRLPAKVGLHFLRHGTKKFIEVNEDMLNEAAKHCELIKKNTESDKIDDYPKNPGYYCKWKDGECSFYNLCFGVKKLDSFIEINGVKNG